MIPVTDLLYKFVILSHKYYVRTISKINIFCVTKYSFWRIYLIRLIAHITALAALFFLSKG